MYLILREKIEYFCIYLDLSGRLQKVTWKLALTSCFVPNSMYGLSMDVSIEWNFVLSQEP